MTWPQEYQRAAFEFERFMIAARDAAALSTTNQSWTMSQAVLLAFRRRLTVAQAAAFGNALPPLLRALFYDGWQPDAQPVPFGDRAAQLAEVRALRPDHNFSPDNSIEAVATALRACMEPGVLDRVLQQLPPEAADFWAASAVQGDPR